MKAIVPSMLGSNPSYSDPSGDTAVFGPFFPTAASAAIFYQRQDDLFYVLRGLTPAWTPQPSDILSPNTVAHCCIIACCSGSATADDGSDTPVGTTVANDAALAADINICSSIYQGQCNISIVSIPAHRRWGPPLVHEFGFLSGSLLRDKPAQITVETKLRGPQDPIHQTVQRLIQLGPHRDLPLSASSLIGRALRLQKNTYALHSHLNSVVREAENIIEEIESTVSDSNFNRRSRLVLNLPPGGLQPLVLGIELNPSETAGNVHVFDIVQTDEQGRCGGITVVAVVV